MRPLGHTFPTSFVFSSTSLAMVEMAAAWSSSISFLDHTDMLRPCRFLPLLRDAII